MKNKAPLALIELTVMVLIFSLAAALCLQAFVWSDVASAKLADRDTAILQAETVAEVIKACHGDFDASAELLGGENTNGSLQVYFDGGFCASAELLDSGEPLLGAAEVTVYDGEEQELFGLTVCWQEVDDHE